jgi:hypothetical protein
LLTEITNNDILSLENNEIGKAANYESNTENRWSDESDKENSNS